MLCHSMAVKIGNLIFTFLVALSFIVNLLRKINKR